MKTIPFPDNGSDTSLADQPSNLDDDGVIAGGKGNLPDSPDELGGGVDSPEKPRH